MRAQTDGRGPDAWRSGLTELEQLIPTVMKEAVVPGAALALVRDGQLAWQRGFGIRDGSSPEPVDERTVFEAASVSKTVFAYAVLRLCEQGVMDLDTPLSRYVPWRFLEGDPRLDAITARHVLSHTAGFQDWRSGREPLKIHFPTGEKFQYSGEGYYYLQSVVTHLAGRVDRSQSARYEAKLEVFATDIDALLKRTVLTPFGMAASSYVWNDELARHCAKPHDVTGKPLTKGHPSAVDAARYASAGGLHTTAADYAKFLCRVVAPTGGAGELAAPLRREMVRPQVRLDPGVKIDDATSWALGWAVQERPSGNVILHSGGQSGFACLTMASVERHTGFVLFTNSDNGGRVFNHPRVIGRLRQMLFV
ncbi:MAG: serine hydrolase domain-containing protein [Opitutaceae bacterium]